MSNTPSSDEMFNLIRSFGYTTRNQTDEIVDAILSQWGIMLVIDQLVRLHDENEKMKELLRENGIKYPKQQPILFTKMVDFEPR